MITLKLRVPVELLVTLRPDGDIYEARAPHSPDLVKAVGATFDAKARQNLYEQRTRSRLSENLVRVESRQGLSYLAFVRATKLHFMLGTPEVKYQRGSGRRVGDDNWSGVVIHADDLAALNLREPE